MPPWVAVGFWVLSSRLGHVRETPKGDPAKKGGVNLRIWGFQDNEEQLDEHDIDDGYLIGSQSLREEEKYEGAGFSIIEHVK